MKSPIPTSLIHFLRPAAALLFIAGLSGCVSASGGGGSDPQISETFAFGAVRSIYIETPVEVRLRGGAGGDLRSLENTVAEAMREHFRQSFGWSLARTKAEADMTARFQLTDWESGTEGTRVGGTLVLESPTGECVFTATTVYPTRFGTGAAGSQTDNLPNLLQTLLKPVKARS